MLALSRQKHDRVIISLADISDADLAALRSGESVIEVMVVDILGDKVRLGIDAPRTVRVDREEVYLMRNEGAA